MNVWNLIKHLGIDELKGIRYYFNSKENHLSLFFGNEIMGTLRLNTLTWDKNKVLRLYQLFCSKNRPITIVNQERGIVKVKRRFIFYLENPFECPINEQEVFLP